MNEYKKYRKEVNKMIDKDDIEGTRKKIFDYYKSNQINKESLIKRYSNISCYEKNFSSYIVGILCGIVSGIIINCITYIIDIQNIIIQIILSVIEGIILFIISILGYNKLIKDWFTDNSEIYINPYEKKLIEAKLKKDYNFEVNLDIQIK